MRIRWKRRWRILLFSFIGIILGILLTVIITNILIDTNSSKSESQELELITVYQLNKSVLADDIINKEFVSEIKVPKMDNYHYSNIENFVGKHAKINLSKGVILSTDLFYDDNRMSDNCRLNKYRYIRLNEKVLKGCMVDIRISFANGADFILLSKKEVVDVSHFNAETGAENALWLKVSEEEILRMSSAVVDAAKNDGCYIYTINYIDREQQESIITYPVNELVQNIIDNDPNIVSLSENLMVGMERHYLESQLKGESNEYNDVELNVTENINLENGSDDELIFFD